MFNEKKARVIIWVGCRGDRSDGMLEEENEKGVTYRYRHFGKNKLVFVPNNYKSLWIDDRRLVMVRQGETIASECLYPPEVNVGVDEVSKIVCTSGLAKAIDALDDSLPIKKVLMWILVIGVVGVGVWFLIQGGFINV